MGGPYVRVFAAMYPHEVCGLVLVDPAHPERSEPLEDVRAWFASHCPEQWPRVEAVCQKLPEGAAFMMAAAAKRLEEYVASLPDSRREAMRREWWALVDSSPGRLSPALSPGAREEFRSAAETFRQAMAARPLPKVPIILLAAGQFDEYSEVTASLSPNMRALHQEMKRRKIEPYQRWVDGIPGAKLVIAQRSGHNIQTEQPRLVIAAIREVIEQAADSGNAAERGKNR
jgi:pimeloyl-ACP methyl ester carboxylesterase